MFMFQVRECVSLLCYIHIAVIKSQGFPFQMKQEVNGLLLAEDNLGLQCPFEHQFDYVTLFNAFITHGCWVPRNMGAGTADPKPK